MFKKLFVLFLVIFAFILSSCEESKTELFTIDNEEAFKISPNIDINLWPSYSDRSKVLGQLERYETVVLLDKDEENNYCEVSTINKDENKSGWLSCDWLNTKK